MGIKWKKQKTASQGQVTTTGAERTSLALSDVWAVLAFSSLCRGRRLQPVQHVLRQRLAAQQRQVPCAVHHMLVC
jgi:hypothetical protein